LKGNYDKLQTEFGENLKTIREGKNMSLRDVSLKCSLEDTKISKIENGKFNIQLSTIFELAKGLGVEPKELLDFKI
jgi:transcriptional regulator with XRE-family HTH domain